MENTQDQAAQQGPTPGPMPQAPQPIPFNFDIIKQNISYLVEKSYDCKAFKMEEVPAVIELKNTLLFFADEKKRQDEENKNLTTSLAEAQTTIAKLNEEIANLKNPPAPEATMDVVKDGYDEAAKFNDQEAKGPVKRKKAKDIDVAEAQFESNHVDQ